MVCDCLTAEDHTLPHYAHCGRAGMAVDAPDNSNIRALAELAAYRDIDVALSVLREFRRVAR
jgi:hypothetical protein